MDATIEMPRARGRVRGLRFPALLGPAATLQAACGLAALGGVYLQWGIAVALIVGGAAGAVLSALHEAGKI